jgi:ribosomal protein L39E
VRARHRTKLDGATRDERRVPTHVIVGKPHQRVVATRVNVRQHRHRRYASKLARTWILESLVVVVVVVVAVLSSPPSL